MVQSLNQIAQTLKDANKKVQLIYAFNGTGKTRLSREFKDLIAPKNQEEQEEIEEAKIKIMYYNAFTEDLFYWDNDLDGDSERKLIVRPNAYTDLALKFLKDENQDGNIIKHFQHYTTTSITPIFNPDFTEITFALQSGGNDSVPNIKISKGEESNFIWCIFFSLIEQIINVLADKEEDRSTDKFNNLKYIFIDDPVSSLDDNHLIELAVNLAELIKQAKNIDIDFIISTHNPLFYNVLYNEFRREKKTAKYRLEKLMDGTYLLENSEDSPFSYHLFLMNELEKVVPSRQIQKYHFNFLRNILEKSATFLGYGHWEDLLSNETASDRVGFSRRILNLYSHSKFSGEEMHVIQDEEKEIFVRIFNGFKDRHGFKLTNSQPIANAVQEIAGVPVTQQEHVTV